MIDTEGLFSVTNEKDAQKEIKTQFTTLLPLPIIHIHYAETSNRYVKRVLQSIIIYVCIEQTSLSEIERWSEKGRYPEVLQ